MGAAPNDPAPAPYQAAAARLPSLCHCASTAGYDRRPCLSRLKPPSWRFRLCYVPPFGAFNGFHTRAPLTT
ncbi:hypothetical protein GCM10022405_20770 [Gibbsiella dentisursi]|uniref:Uncharacterized protein n=1 Tax=Gibbsiella dentisursi TaxID=796890 RepID=A0ABP7L538_9GAMM